MRPPLFIRLMHYNGSNGNGLNGVKGFNNMRHNNDISISLRQIKSHRIMHCWME